MVEKDSQWQRSAFERVVWYINMIIEIETKMTKISFSSKKGIFLGKLIWNHIRVKFYGQFFLKRYGSKIYSIVRI